MTLHRLERVQSDPLLGEQAPHQVARGVLPRVRGEGRAGSEPGERHRLVRGAPRGEGAPGHPLLLPGDRRVAEGAHDDVEEEGARDEHLFVPLRFHH